MLNGTPHTHIYNEELQFLITLLKENDLEEVTLKRGDFEFTAKAKTNALEGFYTHSAMQTSQSPVQQTATVAPPAQITTPEPTGNIVKSPIVGTFYSAPAPDKPPFTEVGKTVKKGDVLMIIESMKLMNEVTSEFDGVVKEILVKDGQAVEFDQALMVIA